MAVAPISFTNMDELSPGPLLLSGHDACFANSADLLEAMGLPGGLLPVQDVIDCGFDKDSGLVWIRQKKKSQHYFRRIRRTVSFDTEIRAYIEKNRLRQVSGVKSKELFIWAPVSDLYTEGSSQDKIKCKTYAGITRTFPAEAFARGE